MSRPVHRPPTDGFTVFKSYLREQRRKSTAQRDAIARVFFASDPHLSVEELYHKVKRKHPGIGYATVYRTMKLLTACGVAVERHFHDAEARYESAQGPHHDHLICEACGDIVEFREERIEELLSHVAHKFSFRMDGHKMELYGLCHTCDEANGHALTAAPAGARRVG